MSAIMLKNGVKTILSEPSFVYNDGGRTIAGYKGDTNDCVIRAISIANSIEYKKVYNDLFVLSGISPRNGVNKKYYHSYLLNLGWEWVPIMKIGTGCTMHLCKEEIPNGTIIVKLSKHLTVIINKIIYDTYNPSRGGTRCVYGYYKK